MSEKTSVPVEVSAEVAVIEKDISKMTASLPTEITNEEQQAEASDFLAQLKARYKEVESQRVEFTKPLLDTKKKIDDEFKRTLTPLKTAIGAVTRVMADFHKKQLEVARKEEERLQKLAEKRQARAEAQGKTPEYRPAPTVEQPEKTLRNDEGKAQTTFSKIWKFEVVDETKVPREFLRVDESAIRRAVAGGAREIEGVRIYEDVSVR